MVLYICVKFREKTSNGIRVLERIRNYEALTGADRRTDNQNFGQYNIIPRHFLWRRIRIGQDQQGIPPLMDGDKVIIDTVGKANTRNRQFRPVFTPVSSQPSNVQPDTG